MTWKRCSSRDRTFFQSILSDIERSNDASPPGHHLVVGQRGMGKSTLLRRLGVELRKKSQLRERFIPLNFAEEQHVEIDRLSRFWLNCLDSMADALEVEGHEGKVEELDALIQKLDQPGTDESEQEPAAREAFLEEITRLGRRPVLFIDNLHLLLERLSKEGYALRGFFTKPGAPIIAGASTVQRPYDAKALGKAFDKHAAAFYDGFKPRTLHRLSFEEVRDVIAGLARAAGNDGVLRSLPAETGRLHALRDLTGGNPRTAYLLYDIFAGELSDDIFHDLEWLLDAITPLYQSYLEQLTDLAQIIVGVLARNQRPLTAKAVTELGSLNRSSVSPQLGRLEDIGLVERVELFGTKKEGYQLAERFFNLWFILRFSSRRERARLRCLARFLKDFYTPQQLATGASAMLEQDSLRDGQLEMALALQDLLDPEDFKAHQLRRKAHLEFIEEMNGVREKIAELIDLKEIAPATFEFAELKGKLRDLVPEGAKLKPDDFVNLVLESPGLLPGSVGDLERSSIAQSSPDAAEFEALVAELEEARSKLLDPLPAKTRKWFTRILRDGIFHDWTEAEELERLLEDHYHDTFFDLILTASSKEVKEAFPDSLTRALIKKRFPDLSGNTKHFWPAVKKCDELGWYKGSCETLRAVLEVDPENADAWSHLGFRLCEHLDRYEEAEAAHRKAMEIQPGNAINWSNLGYVLEHLRRHSDAEEAFRKAIEIEPTHATAWNNLGGLLHAGLGRYEEAEEAFRKAIELDPTYANPWNGLGELLAKDLGRANEAAEAFRKAIKINPAYARPRTGLGKLQADCFGDFESAKESLESAIATKPSYDRARHLLASVLRDYLADPQGARAVLAELKSGKEMPKDIPHLHETLSAAYEQNWGQCADALRSALEAIGSELPPRTRDYWLRSAAVLLHLGYGAELVTLLDETSASSTMLPFFEAIKAHVAGDRDYLLNIEPEARPVAQKIYDEIELRRSRLPESTRRIP